MSQPRAYIRTTRVNGKTQDTRELIFDGMKVGDMTSFELIEFAAQIILSLRDKDA